MAYLDLGGRNLSPALRAAVGLPAKVDVTACECEEDCGCANSGPVLLQENCMGLVEEEVNLLKERKPWLWDWEGFLKRGPAPGANRNRPESRIA